MKLHEIKTAIDYVKAKKEKIYVNFSTKIDPETNMKLKMIQEKEGITQQEILESFVHSYFQK